MGASDPSRIEALTSEQLPSCRPDLIALLRDVVGAGASVGFLPPLDEAEAAVYWDSVGDALEAGGRRLWIARRRGIGRALMEAAETEAQRLGRSTLVLDTRQGDSSERLYRAMGWQAAGTIPRYARSADGALHTTVFYYKLL